MLLRSEFALGEIGDELAGLALIDEERFDQVDFVPVGNVLLSLVYPSVDVADVKHGRHFTIVGRPEGRLDRTAIGIDDVLPVWVTGLVSLHVHDPEELSDHRLADFGQLDEGDRYLGVGAVLLGLFGCFFVSTSFHCSPLD